MFIATTSVQALDVKESTDGDNMWRNKSRIATINAYVHFSNMLRDFYDYGDQDIAVGRRCTNMFDVWRMTPLNRRPQPVDIAQESMFRVLLIRSLTKRDVYALIVQVCVQPRTNKRITVTIERVFSEEIRCNVGTYGMALMAVVVFRGR
ncbi:hypothetical protein SARC_07386 [Sphaeroforma arctica JP610]|uniref:Uncharacterized protein n=1 Tax=Sphaeroforma arctica JP610 TaxID=667725 RepID=A0A0L0FWC1_9EUKA|nr:hypothetical protein SARC_07386 [Sphaeroforma arctica JP610]KNC80248.1 hypothetical protein SARC_07386 [Sphaeroforma arctica JP610]|eukprot:XP_014154150.1 hypothetical protein SARC_07386 [Sphaeroforma arctica JP610]